LPGAMTYTLQFDKILFDFSAVEFKIKKEFFGVIIIIYSALSSRTKIASLWTCSAEGYASVCSRAFLKLKCQRLLHVTEE